MLMVTCGLSISACGFPQQEDADLKPGDLVDLACDGGDLPELTCQLLVPLRERNRQVIDSILDEARRRGTTSHEGHDAASAGMVEAAALPAPTVNSGDIEAFLADYIKHVDRHSWWLKPPEDPANMPQPLRAPANVVQGMVDFASVDSGNRDEYLQRAQQAGDFLAQSWEDAGGRFAFPDWRGVDSHLGRIAAQVMDFAAQHGLEQKMLTNGWIAADPGDGSLYFDNGLAGEALLDLHMATGQQAPLDMAIAAAEWAMQMPLVPNFNYNAFSVVLEARVAPQTSNHAMMQDALERLELGVVSGMYTDGVRVGRWVDEHNDRIVYRMIMARALVLAIDAADAMGADVGELPDLTRLALMAIDAEISAAANVPNPESAIRLYCSVAGSDGDFSLPRSAARIAAVAVEQVNARELRIAPASMGCFLRTLAASD